MTTLRKTTVVATGTTGQQILSLLELLFVRMLSIFPAGHVRTLTIETTASLPPNRVGRIQVAAGEDLSIYDHSQFRDAPKWFCQLPESVWQMDLTPGAAKSPPAARIGIHLHSDQVRRGLEEGWPPSGESIQPIRQLLHHNPDLVLSNEALWLMVGAAGGSTSHAGILSLVDEALTSAGHPRVAVVLAGPYCGVSFDAYETEVKNFLLLRAALQLRQSPRLWVFWLDGANPRERDQVLAGAAELCIRLAVSREGHLDLMRALQDGFNISQRRLGPVLCRVNYRHLITDAEGARARALDCLAEALGIDA